MFTKPAIALVLAGPAIAQGGTPHDAPPIQVPETTEPASMTFPAGLVMHDAPAPGVLLAAGDTWKARFAAEGATYVPFLGADAPRNYPVTFAVKEIRVGGRRVVLDPTNATVRREGNRILIDRGPVVEVYDCAPDSVEQSFLFPIRANAGEVVVELDVTTDLESAEAGEALAFENALGGVRYGAAFAFDEAGREASVARRFDGRTIELTVPAAFPVEPGNVLTLDPVISTRAISPGGQPSRTADVAFEKEFNDGGAYAVVYERFFSQGDSDAYIVTLNNRNEYLSSPSVLDTSSDSWENVRIAGNDGNDQFLAVAEVTPSGGGNRRICGRRIDLATSIGPVFSINSSPGARDAFSPDVGGERVSFVGSGYLVVWEETGLFDKGNVMARVVNASGPLPGDPFAISSSWAWDEGAPRVSATTGEYLAGPSLYNVAWEFRMSNGERRVRGAQVRFDGVIETDPFFATSADDDCHSPSVTSTQPEPLQDTGRRPFVIAYTEEENDGGEVMVAVCDETGVIAAHSISEREGVAFNTDQRNPSIVQTDDEFVLAYSEYDSFSTLRWESYMVTFHLTRTGGAPDVALAERHVLLSNHDSNHSRYVSLASEYEMGGTSNDGLAVWQDWVPNAAIFSGIKSARIESAVGGKSIGVQYCQPEYNSTAKTGWLSATGSQSPTGLKVLLGTDLPPHSIAFFLAATDAGNVLRPGGSRGRLCLGGSIGRYSAFAAPTNAQGSTFLLLNPTQIAQPGGPVAAVSGERWYFQLWHRDTWSGSATSNFSNAIAIDFR